MKIDTCLDCDTALNLTKQSDHIALALVLIDSVTRKLQSQDCSVIKANLYGVPDIDASKEHERSAQHAIDLTSTERNLLPFDSIEGLKASVNQRDQLTCHESKTSMRYIFSLAKNQPVEEFLVVDVKLGGEVHIENIANIIDIYCNCRTHLFEKGYDALTGLCSRKALNDHLPRLLSAASASRRDSDAEKKYFFAFLDLDFFKRVNDDYGHLYGDEVLLMFGRLMRQFFRLDDMLYRYGGEEFCVILKTDSSEQTFAILDRFRIAVEKFPFAHEIKMTVSIGFSALRSTDIPSTVVDRADKSVYFSKRNGRNQTRCYETLLEAGLFTSDGGYQEMEVELFNNE